MTNTEKISKKLRLKILDTIYESGKGHIGGAYSCVDILSVLYFGNILNINKNNYKDLNRNKFILSKGHAAIAQYVVLEKLGLITNDDLNRMNNGGILGEHPDINIPGIECISENSQNYHIYEKCSSSVNNFQFEKYH